MRELCFRASRYRFVKGYRGHMIVFIVGELRGRGDLAATGRDLCGMNIDLQRIERDGGRVFSDVETR